MWAHIIVACHLPRAPSYDGMRTWVEGSKIRVTLRMTVWHRRLQNTNAIPIAIKLPTIILNTRLTINYWSLWKTNGGGPRQYIDSPYLLVRGSQPLSEVLLPSSCICCEISPSYAVIWSDPVLEALVILAFAPRLYLAPDSEIGKKWFHFLKYSFSINTFFFNWAQEIKLNSSTILSQKVTLIK